MGADVSKRARNALLASVALTLLLYFLPNLHPALYWVGYPLMLISTVIHELGHGFTAMIVGGSFDSFVVYADGSGVARTATGGGRIARAMVSAGGLVGPSIGAAAMFLAGRRPKLARMALALSGLAMLGIDVLLVRNLFGFLFIGALGAISLYISTRRSEHTAQLTVVFLAVQLALSVFSRSDYLFTATAQTSAGAMPSDVANIAEALFLPYWFWGCACGLFSLAVLGFGLWSFLRK